MLRLKRFDKETDDSVEQIFEKNTAFASRFFL